MLDTDLPKLGDQLRVQRQRTLIVISGPAEAVRTRARQVLEYFKITQALEVPTLEQQGHATKHLLGTETQAVLFDAYRGFDPDLFGVVVGTVQAGGLCVLLTPPLKQWPDYADPEHTRLTVYPIATSALKGHYLHRASRMIITNTQTIKGPSTTSSCRLLPVPRKDASCIQDGPTQDQLAILHTVATMTTSNTPRLLLIDADRGRGKSAVLGMAAAQHLESGLRVVVTAPARRCVHAVIAHANQHPDLQFYSPDALLHDHPSADLLLVDEAAGIPLPLLCRMADIYPRVVFSSTLHGYEGAGRGFALRFRQALSNSGHAWRAQTLNAPVRYAREDPLEAFSNDLLMLNAQLPPTRPSDTGAPARYTLQAFPPETLREDETRLREIFALFVQAHYQTKPLDVRHILDGPNLHVFGLVCDGRLVAAALVAFEGTIDDTELRASIVKGQRRPAGHLLPQTLAYQHMDAEFLAHRYARIVRIAVHPELQRHGLGRHMLKAIEQRCRSEGIHAIGALFGAHPDVNRFWHQQNYLSLHLGYRRNAASASYSLLVLKTLTDMPALCVALARAQARHQRVMQIRSDDEDIEDIGSLALPETSLPAGVEPSDSPLLDDIHHYARGWRDFESSRCALIHWARHAPNVDHLGEPGYTLLRRRVLENQRWQTVSRDLNLSGRRECESMLRNALRKALEMNKNQ
ncbi:MAG TPA: GNAT family N-acetyltransferase [Gammaproteobacteria bacterium]|nr:GNAT family N-acetyltransferase [Gammaproteobacteria bacterium]